MPNFTTETAVARYPVAFLDSAVNILERLKEISECAEDVSDRLFAACAAAYGALAVFDEYDLADECKDQRNSLANELLEIEIAAHDLDELGALINDLTS